MQKIPSVEIGPGTSIEKAVKQLLDFHDWAEYKGFTSIDGMICPGCEHAKHADPNAVDWNVAELTCGQCGQHFIASTVRTPMGKAFMTQRRVK